MQSEFYNVALDRIRYSLVWEDSRTLYSALELKPSDHVLVITSAGCNVLNSLIKSPASVTAIDLNPVQNRLLLLKKHVILHHPFSVFRSLLGLNGAAAVADSWQQVAQTLPAAEQTYWASFLQCHPQGLLTAGKLEAYVHGFYPTLSAEHQDKLQQLLQFRDVEAQYTSFLQELHGTDFQRQFTIYFDEANLSKGRDPKLFKYAEESGGAAFYSRLQEQVATQLVGDNFFFRFFFFGLAEIPEKLLPPCYREENYDQLRRQLHTLQVVQAEATDYLLSPQGQHINKASLSNIFEYTSPVEFEQVYTKLLTHPTRSLRLVFWNLLQEQGSYLKDDTCFLPALSDALTATDGCFYFCNVRVQESCPATVPVPVSSTL